MRGSAAVPDARLAAAFLAGAVLVAVRFTGSSVAGLAFVAATYTLSSCYSSRAGPTAKRGEGVCPTDERRLSNTGGCDDRRYPGCGRRRPL